MNIELIHERVRAGNYLVKSHAVHHALKEDFGRKHIVEAILNGKIIEEYPDQPTCAYLWQHNENRKLTSIFARRL